VEYVSGGNVQRFSAAKEAKSAVPLKGSIRHRETQRNLLKIYIKKTNTTLQIIGKPSSLSFTLHIPVSDYHTRTRVLH